MPNTNDTSNNGKEVGLELKRLRKRADLTGHVVAEAAGISQSYLSFIENGKVNPSTALVSQIREAIESLSVKSNDDSYIDTSAEMIGVVRNVDPECIAFVRADAFVQGSLGRYAHARSHPELSQRLDGYVDDVVVAVILAASEWAAKS